VKEKGQTKENQSPGNLGVTGEYSLNSCGLPEKNLFRLRHKVSALIPASGYRNYSNGTLNNVGQNGYCWSSSAYSGTNGFNLGFNSSNVYPANNNNRQNGFPVRCVQNLTLTFNQSVKKVSAGMCPGRFLYGF